MAKHKKQTKKTRKKKEEPKDYLTPETRQRILAICLFVLVAVGYLSLFGLAGPIGQGFSLILKIIFGWGAGLSLFVLLIFAWLLIRRDKYQLGGFSFIGLVLFVLSYLGLLHLIIPFSQAEFIASQGQGGGYLGFIFCRLFRHILGRWGSLVVFLALLVVGALVAIETSIKPSLRQEEARKGSWFVSLFKRFWQRRVARRKELAIERERIPLKEDEELVVDRIPLIRTRPKVLGSQRGEKIELPLDLLDANSSHPVMAGDIKANKLTIQKTLENFNIQAEMGEVKIGPTVTQYTLRPAEGIRLSQISSLHNELALALASHPIRIEAPIPGRHLVGIEVPNAKVSVVRVREILESKSFQARSSNLCFALGKDVAGKPWVADLGRMPHLLIAGATGSGKTCAINAIIVSLLYQNSPENLKFILVDPKRVELVDYNNIPYLLAPVITDVRKTIAVLRWTISEMNRRFELFSVTGKRDISDFNADKDKKKEGEDIPEILPHIVIIIDELADLMAAAPREVEACIVRLSQMARATGIHLVMATQRPSVDIITGLIKANITSRIAFSVASIVDSRTILDFGGAEKLLGRGDMLFITPAFSRPKRIQGAYVADKEIKAIVDFLKKKGEPVYQKIADEEEEISELGDLKSDELLPEAHQVVIRARRASASLLQRRLRIGYARAARLLDLLEEEGTIGPPRGAKPRKVLVGIEDREAVDKEGIEYS